MEALSSVSLLCGESLVLYLSYNAALRMEKQMHRKRNIVPKYGKDVNADQC
jgi:hypothetical protein